MSVFGAGIRGSGVVESIICRWAGAQTGCIFIGRGSGRVPLIRGGNRRKWQIAPAACSALGKLTLNQSANFCMLPLRMHLNDAVTPNLMYRRKPLIDADWLLGPAPPRPAKGHAYWKIGCLIAPAAFLLATWPVASAAYLERFLQVAPSIWQSGPLQDVVANPSIAALQQRLPASVPELVAIVAKHPEVRVADEATGVIESFLRQAVGQDSLSLGDLDIVLSRPHEPLTAANQAFLSRLIALRYAQLRESPNSVAVADLPQLLDAYANLLQHRDTAPAVAGQSATELIDSDLTGFAEIDRPQSAVVRLLPTTPVLAASSTTKMQAPSHSVRERGDEPSPNEAQPTHRQAIAAATLASDANPLLRLHLIAPESDSAPMLADVQHAELVGSRPPLPHRLRPTIHTIAYGRSHPDQVAPADRHETPQTSAAAYSAIPVEPASTLDTTPVESASASTDRHTIRRTTNANLLGLLGGENAELSAAAVAELQRRGLSEKQLSLAIDLTRGTVDERMAAMDRVVDGSFSDPVAWLVWLAGDRETKIRGRAIRMLASVSDDAARRQLRLLANRETDPQLRRLIADLAARPSGNR